MSANGSPTWSKRGKAILQRISSTKSIDAKPKDSLADGLSELTILKEFHTTPVSRDESVASKAPQSPKNPTWKAMKKYMKKIANVDTTSQSDKASVPKTDEEMGAPPRPAEIKEALLRAYPNGLPSSKAIRMAPSPRTDRLSTPPKLATLTSGLFERLLILRRVHFFRGVSDGEIQRIAAFFREQCYPEPGSVILKQDDDVGAFYIILSGSVSIAANGVHLGVLRANDYFGEVSLLTSSKQQTTVTTVQANTSLLQLDRYDFNKFSSTGSPILLLNLEFAKSKRTVTAIKSIPFFATLKTRTKQGLVTEYDEGKLEFLAQQFRFSDAGPGQDVFQQGARADGFYIILNGSVSVWSAAAVENGEPIDLNTLRAGDWFGEDALTGVDPRRTVTVTSLEHTSFLKLEKADFATFSEIFPDLRQHITQNLNVRTSDWLRSLPFFSSIKENKPWSKLGLLGSLFTFQQFEQGHVVCREGELSTGFYIIANGSLKVSISDPKTNTDIEVDVLKTGQWFGEMSLLLESPRTATVTCLVPTLLCCLGEKSFRQFNHIAPELSEGFASLVLHRTSNTLQRFPLFRHVRENKPWSKLELLAALLKYRNVEKGVNIIQHDVEIDTLFLVANGKLTVRDVNGNAMDTIQSGDTVGTHALLHQEPACPVTITTDSPCLFLTLDRSQFDQFIKIAPECISVIRAKVSEIDSKYLHILSVNSGTEDVRTAQNTISNAPANDGNSVIAAYIVENIPQHSDATHRPILNQDSGGPETDVQSVQEFREIAMAPQTKRPVAKRMSRAWFSASIETKMGVLKELDLFSAVSESVLYYVASLAQVRTFDAGKPLWQQGAVAEAIYIIMGGSVQYVYCQPDGTLIPLSVLGRNSIVDPVALLQNCHRLLGCNTILPSSFVFLSKDDFSKVRRVDPGVVDRHPLVKSMAIHIADILKVLPFFRASLQRKILGPLTLFDEDRLLSLAKIFDFKEVDAGKSVYEFGERSVGLYYIIRGLVKISADSSVQQSVPTNATNCFDASSMLKEFEWIGDLSKSCLTTVTAVVDTLLLTLTKENYLKFREIAPELTQRIDKRVNLRNSTWLSKLALFSGVKENKPWSKVALLGSLFEFRECDPGEIVCREGDIDQTFYLIVQGRLRATVIHNGSVLELDTLAEDEWFGEMALLMNTPRSATITCIEQCLLCTLTHSAWQRFVSIAPELNVTFTQLVAQRTTQTLKRFTLFDHLKENKPWSKKELLASLLTYKSFEADTVVFNQGDVGDVLYLILHGSVQISVQDNQGNYTEVGIIQSGHYFGEAALLKPTKPRNATATTLSRSLFLSMTHDRFQKFLSVAPEIIASLKLLIAERDIHRNKLIAAAEVSYVLPITQQAIDNHDDSHLDMPPVVNTIDSVEIANCQDLSPRSVASPCDTQLETQLQNGTPTVE